MKNIRNRSAIMLGMFLGVTTLDLSSAPRTRARVTNKGAPVTPAFVKGDSVAKTGFFTLPVIAGGIGALGILGFGLCLYYTRVFGSSKKEAKNAGKLTVKDFGADIKETREDTTKTYEYHAEALEVFDAVNIEGQEVDQKLLSEDAEGQEVDQKLLSEDAAKVTKLIVQGVDIGVIKAKSAERIKKATKAGKLIVKDFEDDIEETQKDMVQACDDYVKALEVLVNIENKEVDQRVLSAEQAVECAEAKAIETINNARAQVVTSLQSIKQLLDAEQLAAYAAVREAIIKASDDHEKALEVLLNIENQEVYQKLLSAERSVAYTEVQKAALKASEDQKKAREVFDAVDIEGCEVHQKLLSAEQAVAYAEAEAIDTINNAKDRVATSLRSITRSFDAKQLVTYAKAYNEAHTDDSGSFCEENTATTLVSDGYDAVPSSTTIR